MMDFIQEHFEIKYLYPEFEPIEGTKILTVTEILANRYIQAVPWLTEVVDQIDHPFRCYMKKLETEFWQPEEYYIEIDLQFSAN